MFDKWHIRLSYPVFVVNKQISLVLGFFRFTLLCKKQESKSYLLFNVRFFI